ncbi:MAG: DNA adenine methylase [Ignavibacteriaceae bacterium]|nr:DNA adenine methylase [Ignavibacteriaceae bacterium]
MVRKKAKPFLKWAGGKGQLISEIEKSLPENFGKSQSIYVEPFLGSGAVLFWMLNNYDSVFRAVVNDINSELINSYKVIASNPIELIQLLQVFEGEYHSLENVQEEKKAYYYKKRELFNSHSEDKVLKAALLIFLNKTCFNGLYRVNKNNEFNVPIGSYKKPMICDRENILAVSNALQRVEILCGDYEGTIKFANPMSLFYFDPPYRPLSSTSSFTSYTSEQFNDLEQIRLRNFCDKLDELGVKWILSNSDTKGKNPNDTFFDDIYSDYIISRVKARRSINANPLKRGELNELIITNYNYEQTLSFIRD